MRLQRQAWLYLLPMTLLWMESFLLVLLSNYYKWKERVMQLLWTHNIIMEASYLYLSYGRRNWVWEGGRLIISTQDPIWVNHQTRGLFFQAFGFMLEPVLREFLFFQKFLHTHDLNIPIPEKFVYFNIREKLLGKTP